MSKQVIELGPDRFEIPKHWKFVDVSKIMEIERGKSFPRRMEAEEGIPYLHYGDIHNSKKNYIDLSSEIEDIPKIAIEISEIDEKYFLKTGDIVLADASEDYQDLCKSVTIFNEDNIPFIAGLHTLVARSEDYDTNYARYLFSIEFVKRQIMRYGSGSTVIGMTKSTFKDVKIPVPPLPEQRKIAAILSSVDRAIEATQQVIAKTERLKKGMMQKLFSEGIGHDEFKIANVYYKRNVKLPQNWEIVKLDEIAEIESGTTPRRSKRKLYYGGKHRWVKTTDLNMDVLSNTEEMITNVAVEETRVKLFPKGTVMVAMYGGPGTIGKSAILGRKAYTNQSVACILPNSDVFNPNYIHYLMLYMRPFWMRISISSRKDPNIKKGDVENLKIPLPPIPEQNDIVDKFDKIQTFIRKANKEKISLIKLKKSLMQQLLNGKIRVKSN